MDYLCKMDIEELKSRIESFSDLEGGWDSYDAEEITEQSIMTALRVLDTISEEVDVDSVGVFPTRDGGVQFEIGDFREIEVLDDEVTEYEFDSDFNLVNSKIWK